MRIAVVSLLLLSMLPKPVQCDAAQQPAAFDPGMLELVISGPADDYADKLPYRTHPRLFKTQLINHSSVPVVFGPSAMNDPNFLSEFQVTDPGGKPVLQRTIFLCSVAPSGARPAFRLTDKNLFVVQPGETRDFDPIDLTQTFLFSEPGEYRIQRVFTFSRPRLKQDEPADSIVGPGMRTDFDASGMSPTKRRMLQDAPSFSVKSNVWTLTIKPL